MKVKNTFAIGCLIQWYEIEMIEEYLQSVKNAVDMIDNKENIIIDLYFNCSQMLEKIDESQMDISKIKEKYNDMIHDMFGHIDFGQYNIRPFMNEVSNIFYTIADYRRDFNDKYCRVFISFNTICFIF